MGYKFCIFFFQVIFISLSQAWNYKNQDTWSSVYCRKAVAQSPIDLQNNVVTKVTSSTPLVFINWDQQYNVSVKNTGYTIFVDFFPNHISVSGGGLPGTYNIVQFHFHWGSEHTLDGQRQALEVHFVGYNNKFNSQEAAVEYANGLAVVTVLYDYADIDNVVLQPIVQRINEIQTVKNVIEMTINPANFLPNDVINFYRYYGSLTTPNCDDVVIWTIFSELCKVSKKQVDEFRSILSTAGSVLTENFRNLQPLNGRTVYKISA